MTVIRTDFHFLSPNSTFIVLIRIVDFRIKHNTYEFFRFSQILLPSSNVEALIFVQNN